jgi:putative hydrolase of the HAD superfamily
VDPPRGGAPRAVLFDLFHTLICLRPGGDRGEPTWKALGLDKKAWEHSFFTDHDGRATGSVRDAVESIRLVAHRIDPSIPMERIRVAAEQRARRFQDAFLNVDPGVLRGLERLQAAGVRMGLVSNASWEEVGHWEDSPLSPFFETAAFSCAVGIAKPDAGIYEHVLDQMDVAPEDAWFVGDGGSDEHHGARAVGLRPVLVRHLLRRVWPEYLETRAAHADLVLEDIEDVAAAVEQAGNGA